MSVITSHHQLIVVVALIERDNKILIVRRHDPEHAQWHRKWGFPGGKIELHETPMDALRREIKEETNLTISSERLLGIYTHHWNTPKGIQQTFILLHHCNAIVGEVHPLMRKKMMLTYGKSPKLSFCGQIFLMEM